MTNCLFQMSCPCGKSPHCLVRLSLKQPVCCITEYKAPLRLPGASFKPIGPHLQHFVLPAENEGGYACSLSTSASWIAPYLSK